MKQLIIAPLFLLSVTATSSLANAQLGGLFGGPKIETIETDQLQKMLSAQHAAAKKAADADERIPEPNFVVVDVRSDKEINVSVIPGAITKAHFEKDVVKYRGRLVIPYCTVGARSGAYAKQSAEQGVKVKNYKGSILKWIDAGLPRCLRDGLQQFLLDIFFYC